MRILAIRGRNLASLAAFEIDLTREPLAGTGLFAITGDTGAGKSTILDAMCLALYGEHPRSRVGRNEAAPDPGNSELQASDPRNILRRGAGEGMAEVDFIGQDAISYRATWIVRRANGKPAGKLQKVDRKLDLLDGSGNIAVGIKAVDAAIIVRTGFTFDQFSRTVLLAQGEFDRFLLASEAERADLLERITGTEIYSCISRRVHEQTAERERLARDHRSRRDAIALLSDAARAGIARDIDDATGALQVDAAEIERIEKRVNLAEHLLKLRQDLADAEMRAAIAERSVRATEPDRVRLQRLRDVEPLRALAVARDERTSEAVQATAEIEALARGLADAELKRATADAEWRLAEQALHQASADVQLWQPEWIKAAALDRDVLSARREHETAQGAAIKARQSSDAISAEADQLQRRQNKARARIDTADSALSAQRGFAILHEDAARIDELIAQRSSLLGRLQKAIRDSDAAEAQTQRIDETIAATEARTRETREEIAALGAELLAARHKLHAFDMRDLEASDAAQRRLASLADQACEAARRRDHALNEVTEARRVASEAKSRQRTLDEQLAQALRAHAGTEQLRGDAARLAELADATASAHAEHLRATLVDGSPCPVCGADAHPFAASGDTASQLVRDIRQRRDTIESRHAALSSEIVDLKGNLATVTAVLSQSSRAAEMETARAAAASRQLAALDLAAHAAGTEAAVIIAGHASETMPLSVLEDFSTRIAELRDRIDVIRQGASALQSECTTLEDRIGQLDAALADDEAANDVERARLPALTANAREHTTTVRLIGDQLRENATALSPYLRAGGLSIERLDSDAVGARAQLSAAGAAYARLAAERDTAAQEEAALAPLLIGATERQRAAAAACDDAIQRSAQRYAVLHDLETARAKLLDGEPTEQHRKRVLDAEARARELHTRLLDAARLAASELDRLVARREPCQATAQAAADRRNHATAHYAAALASRSLSEPEALTLLAVSAHERDALAHRVEQVERDAAAAGTVLRERQTDLTALRTDEIERDAATIETLRVGRAEIAQRRDDTNKLLAIARHTLTEDDDARQRVAAVDAESHSLLADLQIWRDVDAAIGHGEGVKFKRFAQGVTLANLVGLANRELAALNPRYALRQGATSDLALDVVDREMGEDVRSPRTLSGGERFLVSLALALALAGLEGRQSFVDTLFIDEGFGGLDPDTLDMAIDALEGLQGQGRKVGVITHVGAMIERIAIQVRVEKRGRGRSVVTVGDAVAA